MMICDTGPLVAALNARDPEHRVCADLLARFAGEVAAPAPVVTETALFSLRRFGADAQLLLLESVAAGEIEVLDLEPADHQRIVELCRKYRDLPLDQVDASVIAIAERLGHRTVASIDRRHFSVVRLEDGSSLELLPAL